MSPPFSGRYHPRSAFCNQSDLCLLPVFSKQAINHRDPPPNQSNESCEYANQSCGRPLASLDSKVLLWTWRGVAPQNRRRPPAERNSSKTLSQDPEEWRRTLLCSAHEPNPWLSDTSLVYNQSVVIPFFPTGYLTSRKHQILDFQHFQKISYYFLVKTGAIMIVLTGYNIVV